MPRCLSNRAKDEDSGIGTGSSVEEEEDGPDELSATNSRNSDTIETSSSADCEFERSEEARGP